MRQGLDSGDCGPDVALGERLRSALAAQPELEVQQVLNLIRDLMGDADSLFPALKVLATQPSFGELLRASSGPAARPHLDAVLAFAGQMLAPAMVQRLEWMLGAATGLAPVSGAVVPQTMPLPVSLKAPPSTPSNQLGTVVASRSDSQITEPGTVMASSLHPPATAPLNAPAAQDNQQRRQALQSSLRTLLLALVVLFGVYGALRSPWLCESFDLCNTDDSPPKAEPNASATTTPAAPRPTPQKAVAPVVVGPLPRSRPKPQPPQSREPASDPDGPLWP